jgi:uncharacterized membrane protein
MDNYESYLNRWLSAEIIDTETAIRIRNFEMDRKKPAGLKWQVVAAMILGGILLASGVVLFVSAHWSQISPGGRFCLVIAMVAVFHLAGGWARENYRHLSTTLHAVGTVTTGAAIALVGQIFNIQEHWPTAILLWALAALAGWILLRDEAQQTLTMLLFPAWMLSEFEFHAIGHIGQQVYTGRFLVVWAMLYLTVFLGSKHKIARGILFVAAAIASVAGITSLLSGWQSWSSSQSYLPLDTRIWAWIILAVLPLLLSLRQPLKSTLPVFVAILFSIALPWCYRIETSTYYGANGFSNTYSHIEPNLPAYALVAVFTIAVVWWGVRQTSRSLVNLGIVGFAATVLWFYFSNIFDKIGRSLGLIGLGVLFLAGGWVLEKTRRGLVATLVATKEEQ